MKKYFVGGMLLGAFLLSACTPPSFLSPSKKKHFKHAPREVASIERR